MRYYVTADPHGHCSLLKSTLQEQGFFADPQPHKLIICGDLMDRGKEALAMQEFILELIEKELVILIRGNHEELALELLNGWHQKSYYASHHLRNGTVDTVCQLTRRDLRDLEYDDQRIYKRFANTPYVQKILPATVDFFETAHYVFVHGWIPTAGGCYLPRWRQADAQQWYEARWVNGMEAAYYGLTDLEKTIVCGHFHTSFGHSVLEGKGPQWGPEADFSPYRAPGILAMDACTAYSGKINCVVIED